MLIWKGFCKTNMVAVILCDPRLQLPFYDPNTDKTLIAVRGGGTEGDL
jgi:hypothetical protein